MSICRNCGATADDFDAPTCNLTGTGPDHDWITDEAGEDAGYGPGQHPLAMLAPVDHPIHHAPFRGVVVLEVLLDPESQAPFEPVLYAIRTADLPGLVSLHVAIEGAAYDVVRLVATKMPYLSDYVRRVT
jgi:hypothetical protein